MSRLTALWIAVAAVAITALLTVAAGELASLGMGWFLGNHEKWWWRLVINGLTWLPTAVAIALPIGIALHRRRVLRRSEHVPPTPWHLRGLPPVWWRWRS
jgi:hypothetical protein